MKKFNSHMHYILPGRECQISRCTTIDHEEMQRQMEKNKVVGALVMYCPPKIPSPTEMELVDLYRENIYLSNSLDNDRTYIKFAIMNPERNTPDELESLVEDHEFKGLKLIAVFDGVPYTVETYGTFIEKAADLEIPTMIHSGWEDYAEIEHIEPLIENYPDQKFIIAHMRPNDRGSPGAHVKLLDKHDNLYMETSYIDHTDRIKQMIELGLTERVLWGDDFPWGGGNILHNSRVISDAPISKKEEEMIFHRNAEELFSIKLT